VGWVEKRLRGAKVFVLVDEQGQPQSGSDNRVEIVYRPGGKPYRAALTNLEDLPGAAPLSDAEMAAQSESPAPSSATPPRSKARARSAEAAGPPATNAVHIYTDGACTGNPGPMGIGAVILDATREVVADGRRELSSYLGLGTNNIAELTAIKRAVEILPRDRPIVIYTDSGYSIGVLSLGWRAKANQALIAEIRQLLGGFARVDFVKVAGHAGIPENERCDELARQAIVRRQP
jgi:ribonuclease HI